MTERQKAIDESVNIVTKGNYLIFGNVYTFLLRKNVLCSKIALKFSSKNHYNYYIPVNTIVYH